MAVLDAGSILVVCTGNVCRSPYIERRLRQELARTGIAVTSAGAGALVGRVMDPQSGALLQDRGAIAGGFTAQQLNSELVHATDLVIAAAREHRSAAARLHPSALRKAVTLRDLADLLQGVSTEDVIAHGASGSWVAQVLAAAQARRASVPARQEGVDITDPIGQPRAVFEQMAAEIEGALSVIVPVLRGAPAR